MKFPAWESSGIGLALLASVSRLSCRQILLPQNRSVRPPRIIMHSLSLTGIVLAVIIQRAPDHAFCQKGILTGQRLFTERSGCLIVIPNQLADVVRDACLRLAEKIISQVPGARIAQ